MDADSHASSHVVAEPIADAPDGADRAIRPACPPRNGADTADVPLQARVRVGADHLVRPRRGDQVHAATDDARRRLRHVLERRVLERREVVDGAAVPATDAVAGDVQDRMRGCVPRVASDAAVVSRQVRPPCERGGRCYYTTIVVVANVAKRVCKIFDCVSQFVVYRKLIA